MVKPKVLVLAGDGVNCERETALGFDKVGGCSKIIHINDLLKNPKRMNTFQVMALPGGFSFGDELGSGKVLALKLSKQISSFWKDFSLSGKPMIGICNGFQTLVKAGLLPLSDEKEKISLSKNTSGKFINKWVDLEVKTNSSFWFKDMKKLYLPIRHGEGRIAVCDDEIGKKIEKLAPLRYTENVNGSYRNIAGLVNEQGNILGLMPHPEAYHHKLLAPRRNDQSPLGIQLFKNAIDYLR